MDKHALIAELLSLKKEILSLKKYKGQAQDKKKIEKVIAFLKMYKVEESLVNLLYKEHIDARKSRGSSSGDDSDL